MISQVENLVLDNWVLLVGFVCMMIFLVIFIKLANKTAKEQGLNKK